MLRGLIFTEDGERLQPSFTTKTNGKRYRYYVPRRTIRYGANRHPTGMLPALAIEQMVLEQVHAALMAPEVVQSVWDAVRRDRPDLTEPEVVLPLRRIGEVWALMFPAERQRIVRLLIGRVIVRENAIEIIWRDPGWSSLAGEMRPGTIGAELLEMEEREEAIA